VDGARVDYEKIFFYFDWYTQFSLVFYMPFD